MREGETDEEGEKRQILDRAERTIDRLRCSWCDRRLCCPTESNWSARSKREAMNSFIHSSCLSMAHISHMAQITLHHTSIHHLCDERTHQQKVTPCEPHSPQSLRSNIQGMILNRTLTIANSQSLSSFLAFAYMMAWSCAALILSAIILVYSCACSTARGRYG